MKLFTSFCLAITLSTPGLAQQKPGMALPSEPSAEDLLQGEPTDGVASAYLLVPFIEFSEREQAFFLNQVVPMLTVDHAMTNTGSAGAPWYCFAYSDAVSADYGRRTVQAMRGGETLGAKLMIDATCAAG